MSNVDMCKHEWPGSGCKQCDAEAMSGELEQQARELLAAECYAKDAENIRSGKSALINSNKALAAITKALSTRPSGSHYCSYCDAAKEPAPGYLCPDCGNRLAGPMSTRPSMDGVEIELLRRALAYLPSTLGVTRDIREALASLPLRSDGE